MRESVEESSKIKVLGLSHDVVLTRDRRPALVQLHNSQRTDDRSIQVERLTVMESALARFTLSTGEDFLDSEG